MSKAIRWQVPFASISGTKYRVDIYDEQDGTWSGITQLLAGDTPFVTDEDSSEDFFAPIRTQTGTLQVCTALPNGGRISLDELLPANNIARPIRLINLDNSNAIEWQGFLSCEAYSQNYTTIPENLSLSVISVLEAMDSVEAKWSESMSFQRILSHCIYAMKAIETESGMSLFGNIYIDGHCNIAMIAKYFFNNVYWDANEQVSGDNIVVEAHSISCKNILERAAEFFGCCWRENGRDIYFEAVGLTTYYAYDTFSNIYNSLIAGTSTLNMQNINAYPADLASREWMETGHKRTIMQGVRRVNVTSKLKDFSCDISLRESPVNSLEENPSARQANWCEVYCNTNENFYNLAEHKHRRGSVTVSLNQSYVSGKLATINLGYNVSAINYENTWFWDNDLYLDNYTGLFLTTSGPQMLVDTAYHYLTSFMGYMRTEDEQENWSLESGLVICGFPDSYRYGSGQYLGISWPSFTKNDYIYKISNPLQFVASKGKFQFKLQFKAFITNLKTQQVWRYKQSGNERGVDIAIKWGNKWLKKTFVNLQITYEWVDQFTIISAKEHSKNTTYGMDGVFTADIPINSLNNGIVSIYVFPKIYGDLEVDGQQNAHGLFITALDLSYQPPEEELVNDRSENIYATEIINAFRDEVSIDLNMASDVNNTKLATMLWESDGVTPVQKLTLDGVQVRPEMNLLDRLATYYGSVRQRLELIVKHPVVNNQQAALPLLKLNGISPDTRKYLPLAESRDWRTDECTLTCFETPTE